MRHAGCGTDFGRSLGRFDHCRLDLQLIGTFLGTKALSAFDGGKTGVRRWML